VIGRSAAALLAALVLALSACGDDSGGGEDSSGNSSYGRGTGPAGNVAPAEPGPTGTDDKRKADPDRKDERAPRPTAPPEDRGDGTRPFEPKPVPRKKLIYEQSRYLCGQVGVEALRREYGIESSDPEAVARAVSHRTSMRGAGDAVYSGCLAGLRSAK
jgi:hypothetical protein